MLELSANISQAVPLAAAFVNLIADELLVFIVILPLNVALVAVTLELNVALVPLNALLTKVTVVPSSVIALFPIVLVPVNLGR